MNGVSIASQTSFLLTLCALFKNKNGYHFEILPYGGISRGERSRHLAVRPMPQHAIDGNIS